MVDSIHDAAPGVAVVTPLEAAQAVIERASFSEDATQVRWQEGHTQTVALLARAMRGR